ncbi:MAG: hypothetical protein MK291_02150 [Planctomycetes bacterium]|nr:hypothetical protein [Planctomycetota bacterium]
MKNLFLSILVATAAVACNATNAAVTDAADASAPGADCATECATVCSDAQKAECAEAKSECSEAQVCPVTGAKVEG